MSEVLFVLKSFAVTVAILFLMQVKVGHSTVQHHLMSWMDDSVAVDGLRYIAEGAVALGSKAYDAGSKLIGSNSKEAKTENASRGYSFEIKRSEAYYKQKRREESKRKVSHSHEDAGPEGPEID
jgi:hypothetical protein